MSYSTLLPRQGRPSYRHLSPALISSHPVLSAARKAELCVSTQGSTTPVMAHRCFTVGMPCLLRGTQITCQDSDTMPLLAGVTVMFLDPGTHILPPLRPTVPSVFLSSLMVNFIRRSSTVPATG